MGNLRVAFLARQRNQIQKKLKINKTIKEGAMTLRTQDYVGGIEYTNNQLKAIYHSEGQVYYGSTTSRYEYNITDHLGNVRLTFTDKGGDGFVDMTNNTVTIYDNSLIL